MDTKKKQRIGGSDKASSIGIGELLIGTSRAAGCGWGDGGWRPVHVLVAGDCGAGKAVRTGRKWDRRNRSCRSDRDQLNESHYDREREDNEKGWEMTEMREMTEEREITEIDWDWQRTTEDRRRIASHEWGNWATDQWTRTTMKETITLNNDDYDEEKMRWWRREDDEEEKRRWREEEEKRRWREEEEKKTRTEWNRIIWSFLFGNLTVDGRSFLFVLCPRRQVLPSFLGNCQD
jgi:hypothetical protein